MLELARICVASPAAWVDYNFEAGLQATEAIDEPDEAPFEEYDDYDYYQDYRIIRPADTDDQ